MADEVDYFSTTVDASETAPEDIQGGGNFIDAEGRFHVQITKVDIKPPEFGENASLPVVAVTMTVLAGTDETQIEKSTTHRLFIANWADKKTKDAMVPVIDAHLPANEQKPQGKGLLWFLYSFGVIALNQKITITQDTFRRLEQCQAIIKITLGKDRQYKDKNGVDQVAKGRHEMQWSNDCWPVDHESVADVPKDHEALAYAGKTASAASSQVQSWDLDDI